ncbi:MAG: MFS transporter [Desulfonatronovibrionaceae bacterium]
MLSGYKKYSEPWYAGYAFQGAVVLGIAPILIPLVVGNALGAAAAGTVVAAFYAGQLTAPILGALTDKSGRYHFFYLAGYVLLALGLIFFPALKSFWFWTGLAFIQGMGSAVTNTVSAMFIVENKPKSEWDQRIGWLQTFYGTGQAAGLALVALLQLNPQLGMVIAGLLMLPGFILGRMHLPSDHKSRVNKKDIQFAYRTHRPARGAFSILHTYEQNLPHYLREVKQIIKTPFALYILAWFCIMFSNWVIYNLYPLLMHDVYTVSAGKSSLYYAIGAGIGVFAYAPAGALGKKIGDGWVVMIGALMSLLSLLALTGLAFIQTGINPWLVPLFFFLLPVAWSPLIVAGTDYTAELSELPQGTAVGIFNATTAVASLLSAFAAGLLADQLGYKSLPIAGLILAGAGTALMLMLLKGVQKKASRRKTA